MKCKKICKFATKKIMAQQVNDSNFEQIVLSSDKPVLVDFWAEWCGPCRAIGPIIEELSKEYEGKAVIVKLNTDENPVTPTNYGIRSIPTLLFFKDGKVVDKLIGAVPKPNIKAKLDALL
jgi:thioredoxin 1